MFKNPFSFNGRIRRAEFGLSVIIYWAAFMFIIMTSENGQLKFYDWLFLIPAIWFTYSQGAKRCHDIGHSGFFQLIPLYTLAMLFIEGQTGDNKYGPDPKQPGERSNDDIIFPGSQ
jgi:uncharacterized membrane protein YhaH (DUF805 family)